MSCCAGTRPCTGEFEKTFMRYADRHNMSWTAWAWQKPTPGDKREECALLESVESGTPAAPVGTAVHRCLVGGAGSCG